MSLLPPILVIDDSGEDRELVALVLRGAFGEVAIEEASDAAALARAVSAGRFGLVLTEHELPWIRSGDVLRLIRDLKPGCPVVVLSRSPAERVAGEILHLGPDGIVPKTSTGWVGLPQVLRTALFESRRRLAADGREPGARQLLDSLPLGVFVASREGTLLDANPALAAILGYPRPEQCVQRALGDLFAARADAEAWEQAVEAAAGATAVEARLRRADGSTVWARLRVWPAVEGPVGPRLHGLVEAPARAGAAALTRSGEELEEIGYLLSHDLAQPLTQIKKFLDLLDQEAGGALDADARGWLEQARSSAARLEGMADAVLRCARIEGRDHGFAPVEVGAVLARVLARLDDTRAASGAEITADPLPTLVADEDQIEQLLQNLLANALKFHGAAPPRVHVGAADEGEHWHLWVGDNGIGISSQDFQRIFVMFQRLHTASEYEGSGIGLAICRRIVARHGGRIWVESQPGQGATFHLTLEKVPAAAAAAREG
ncbi:MAG TPA: ATP-binding protein [Thermoanaerobaculia bacterium]|jgi:PAS domain S-box-containing protein|nr:ATP-binding protein [Thermoanaerobaculia bacterium]